MGGLACLATVSCGDEPGRQASDALTFSTSPADLQRATSTLLSPADAIALPPVTVEGAIYRTTRLHTLFSSDQVTSRWRSSSTEDFLLAERGPVTSSQPAAGIRVEDKRGLGGRRYRWLIFDGLNIEREQIGQIALRGDFGDSEYFVLSWPGVRKSRFDLVGDASSTELLISTEGFLKWHGTLRRLEIGIPISTERDEEIRVESLRLIDRRASFPDPAGVRDLRVGRVLMKTLYLHGGTRLQLQPSTLVDGDRFAASVAVASAPVDLTITARADDASQVLFEGRVTNVDAWKTVPSASVDGLQGDVVLELEARGDADAVVLIGGATLYAPHDDPQRVILYLIDTLGARRMSLYGYDRETTPNLARLAGKGTWFPNAFSTGPWTPEVVPGLLTSLYTPSHGLTEEYGRLADDFFTLADAYAAAGYATVAFSTNGNAGPARGTAQGFDAFYDHIEMGQDAEAQLTVPVDEVLAWLEDHHDRPVFMYVHTAEPHDPYDPPTEFKDRFAGNYVGPVGTDWPARNNLVHEHKDATAVDRQQLSALYDADVAYSDSMFGQFVDTLERRQLLDQTLLAVTSDHGEEFGEHGVYGHGSTLYDELIRVPLILWGPDFFAAASPPAVNTSILDIMPTLLDLSGIETSAPMQGSSLADFVRAGGSDQVARLAERDLLSTGHIIGRGPKYAILSGNRKLVLWTADGEFEKLELYDLSVDPSEQDNLVEAYPDEAANLLSRLVSSYAALPVYTATTEASEGHQVSQEQIERLRALGYLE